MKSIIHFTVLLLFILNASACRKDRHWVKGEGNNVTNTRFPGKFDGVSLSIDANVEIYRDSAYHIEMVAQQNILNVIETKVSGNHLCISLSRFTNIRSHNPITIRVYTPDLNYMDVNGSGNMICGDAFSTGSLNCNVSGSGDIRFSGNIQNEFNANISGSGSISYSGNSSCNSAHYTISGSGDINAEWLKVNDVDAHISGSGDMRVYAVNSLEAHISGSGDIYYRGQAAVNSYISGSGRLIPIQ